MLWGPFIPEPGLLVDVDYLAVHDEDAVVEFCERKDVHSGLALEHVIVDVLEGYGLARRDGERHLWDLVGGDDEPHEEVARRAFRIRRHDEFERGAAVRDVDARDCAVGEVDDSVLRHPPQNPVPRGHAAAFAAGSDLVELGNVKNVHLLVHRVLDFHPVVDRDVAERLRALSLSVSPHEADASVLILVEPVDRAFRAIAETDVEDAVDPFHEVRVQLLSLEERACRLEAVAVDLHGFSPF